MAGVITMDGKAIPVYRLAGLTGETDGGGLADAAMREIAVIEMEGHLAGLLVESTDSIRGPQPAQGEDADGVALLEASGVFAGTAAVKGSTNR